MRPSEDRYEVEEDAAPLDLLVALFEARGWPCESTATEMSGEIQGSWTKYQLRGIWRPEDMVLQILCLPDIRIAKDKLTPAYELVSMINEQMWLGQFEIWSNGGVLLYRNATILGDDGMLSLGQAQALVEIAVDECDRFYPAFQFVLWGGRYFPQPAFEIALKGVWRIPTPVVPGEFLALEEVRRPLRHFWRPFWLRFTYVTSVLVKKY